MNVGYFHKNTRREAFLLAEELAGKISNLFSSDSQNKRFIVLNSDYSINTIVTYLIEYTALVHPIIINCLTFDMAKERAEQMATPSNFTNRKNLKCDFKNNKFELSDDSGNITHILNYPSILPVEDESIENL